MVKNSKKFLVVVLCALMVSVICFAFAGCEEGQEKKYDVAIRIGCSDGEIYEFPVGTEELHIEIPYDGVERTYYVDTFNLPDHPRWSEDWISPSGEGANVFGKTMTYCEPGGLNASYSGTVKEKGEYCISIYADSTSDLWNFRSIYLFINVI